jgi:hypothetical protein
MKPRAPSQSPAHIKLRQLAPPRLPSIVLRKFLWEINAHWKLVALPLVCHNLQQALSVAEQTWGMRLGDWGIESWPDVLGWIGENKANLVAEIGGGFGRGFDAKGHHPLMRWGIERHWSTPISTLSSPALLYSYPGLPKFSRPPRSCRSKKSGLAAHLPS